MPTNVLTNRKTDNLKNAEIWPVKFLMFKFKRLYLSCPSSNFNDLGIKIDIRLCFIQNQRKFEDQTVGFYSIVHQTPGTFLGNPVRIPDKSASGIDIDDPLSNSFCKLQSPGVNTKESVRKIAKCNPSIIKIGKKYKHLFQYWHDPVISLMFCYAKNMQIQFPAGTEYMPHIIFFKAFLLFMVTASLKL